MKYLLMPSYYGGQKIKYVFKEKVVKVEVYDNVDNKELLSVEYVDLSNIEEGKLYNTNEFIKSATIKGREMLLELLNYVGDDATESESFPEWQNVEFTEFDIPDGAEIIVFEEKTMPKSDLEEKDNQIRDLKSEISSLRTRLEYSDTANQAMMFEVFEYISML